MDSDDPTNSPETPPLKSTQEQGSRQKIWSLSLAGNEESDTLDNLKRHREAILRSLNPSQLFGLYHELSLGGVCMNDHLERAQKAEQLLDQVIQKNAYSAFLDGLEGDTEHMGHRYIVSLLRGEQFARDEEIQASKKLAKKITRYTQKLVEHLDIQELGPYLMQEGLVTRDELEELQNPTKTSQKRAMTLLTLLATKGPTAYYIFVHRCLAKKAEYRPHRDIYLELTRDDTPTGSARKSRKRKAAEDMPQLMVAKRYPNPLQTPEGLKTEQYFETMTKLRDCHLNGIEHWQEAEEIYITVMNSLTVYPEMKIAILLESCTRYIVDNQPDVVIERVTKARNMCMDLHTKNIQVLEGRCEWILAELHRHNKRYAEAKRHLDTAFSLIYNCELGEDRALVSYTDGCILLDRENATRADVQRATNALKVSISCATEVHCKFLVQQCKICLARAHISLSSSTSDSNRRGEKSSEENMAEAKRLLKELETEQLPARTRCMLMYTWSDVYRIEGDNVRASEYAAFATETAESHGFEVEIRQAEAQQETNAPPEIKIFKTPFSSDQNCVICEKSVSDSEREQEAIFCGGECNGWMHRVCAGLSRRVFQSAKGSSSPFLCHYCQNNTQKREIELLKFTISNLEEKLEQAKSRTNISSLDTIKDPLTRASSASVSEKETVDGAISFNPLKYDKRYTMVVYGVEECESGTLKSKRTTHDTKQVTATLQSVHSSLSEHAVDSCLRLGKYNPTKCRPILVRLTRSCDVSAIFSNCSKLVDRPNIAIKPVMSKEEQQVESLLLWARRQLIDTGTPGKTIRIKGNCLFVNDEKHGSVVDSEYIQSTIEITNS